MVNKKLELRGSQQQNGMPEPLLGALAGLAGGLVASGAMNAFQAAWQAVAGDSSSGSQEPSTVKAAERIAEPIGSLPQNAKPAAGNAVHFAFGATLGALYGLAAEYLPAVTFGRGTAFGIGSMLFVDDLAVPAVGLAQSTDSSIRTHAYSAASHLVYGGALEVSRKLIRSAA